MEWEKETPYVCGFGILCVATCSTRRARKKRGKNCRIKYEKNEGNRRRKRDYQFSISHAIPKKSLSLLFMHMVHHIIISTSSLRPFSPPFVLPHFFFVYSPCQGLNEIVDNQQFVLFLRLSLFLFLRCFAKCRSGKQKKNDTATMSTTQNEDRQFLRKRRTRVMEEEERNAKHQKMRRLESTRLAEEIECDNWQFSFFVCINWRWWNALCISLHHPCCCRCWGSTMTLKLPMKPFLFSFLFSFFFVHQI